MRSLGQHLQQELESVVAMANQVLGDSTQVQQWVTTPAVQWENRSPMRVVMDGDGLRVIDFLVAKGCTNEK